MIIMKVSIIIPVYNIELYVERCINSIINQTCSNIEIIVVNDGSTDKSLEIISKFSYDKRLIVINKKNSGLSDARNAGLEQCNGDYVMFVDGDDYLENNTIEILNNIITKDQSIDMVLFPYKKQYKNKTVPVSLFDINTLELTKTCKKSHIYSTLIGPGKYTSNMTPLTMDRLNTAWGKIYKRDVIGTVRFTDTKIIGPEDGWFNIQVVKKCKKIVYTTQIHYIYEKTNTTSLLHKYNQNLLEKRWNMYKLIEEFLLSSQDQMLIMILYNRIILEQFGLLKNICCSNLDAMGKKAEIKKLLYDSRYISIWNKADLNRLNIRWQLFFLLCRRRQIILIQFIFLLIDIVKTLQEL